MVIKMNLPIFTEAVGINESSIERFISANNPGKVGRIRSIIFKLLNILSKGCISGNLPDVIKEIIDGQSKVLSDVKTKMRVDAVILVANVPMYSIKRKECFPTDLVTAVVAETQRTGNALSLFMSFL